MLEAWLTWVYRHYDVPPVGGWGKTDARSSIAACRRAVTWRRHRRPKSKLRLLISRIPRDRAQEDARSVRHDLR